jgi:peptidoglycan/xylan/chitin deacetylase (PgdA/CDA1 family)
MSNYQVQTPTIFESFETLGNWTASGTAGGSVTVDSTIFSEGTGSLKIVTAGGASSNYSATKTINRTFTTDGVMSIDLYVPDTTKITSPTIYLSEDSGFTDYYSYTLSNATMTNGWNRILLHRSGWSATGAPSWSTSKVRLRVRVDATSNQIGTVYFDNFIVGRYNRPKFIFRFDDNRDTQYTQAYPILRKYGFKASVFVISSKVGTNGYMTQAQMDELHNEGWDMSIHTDTHTDLSTQTLAQQQNEFTTCQAYLKSKNYTRRDEHKHVVFPFGGYDDNTLIALRTTEMLSGGTILSPRTTAYPLIDPYLLKIDNIAQTVTLSSALSRVDRTISDGGATIFLFHVFVTPAVASTEWPVEDLESLCQYLSKKRNEIDVVTFTEFYQEMSSNRKLLI